MLNDTPPLSQRPRRAPIGSSRLGGMPVGESKRIAEMEASLQALQQQALELNDYQNHRLRRWIMVAVLLMLAAGGGAYGYGVMQADKLAAQKAVAQAAEIVAKQKAAEAGPSGIRLAPSTDTAVLRVQKKAATGDVKAQYELALIYEQGRGVAVDKPLAQSLLQNAAAAGHPPAMMELGSAYLTGRFGAVDKHAAMRWLEAAATSGNAIAAFKLGELFESGLDGAPDNAMALGWYQRAAGLGSDPALVAIARLAPKKPPITVAEVKRIQIALRALGYNIGVADGKMGAQTADAIKAYQQQVGMMADGRPTYFLLEKLEDDRVMQGG
jgi:TPR repeat protein